MNWDWNYLVTLIIRFLLSEYYRGGRSTQTSSQQFWNQDGDFMGKISFFPKNMDIHETPSLSLHPNISRGGMHDKDPLRAYVITGVFFHQKSVIYFCQGSMISKWCYAWKYCFKSRLDPVYLSKLIKLIHSIIKAYNLP